VTTLTDTHVQRDTVEQFSSDTVTTVSELRYTHVHWHTDGQTQTLSMRQSDNHDL